MVIMTGVDWILRGSTPVRSGHQSALTKALCNKRRGGERYWLPRVNISKSLSLFFFHLCLYPSITSLPLSYSLSDLPLYTSTYALSIPHLLSVHPLSISNHLFIADLFILYSFGLGTVHAVTVRRCYRHSFTPSSSSSTERYLGAGGVTLVQSNAVLIPLDN